MRGAPLALEERYLIHAGFVGGLGVAAIAKQFKCPGFLSQYEVAFNCPPGVGTRT